MRNLFLFIRRYITFLIFIALQAISLWMLFSYNRFHKGKGMGIASQVTGRINGVYNDAEDFINMREENKRLLRMNDSLINLQKINFQLIDTSMRVQQDSIPYDTLGHYRQYIWRDATVVYSTAGSEKNYIQINRGSSSGIKDNMGVFSSNGGLVGLVVNTGKDYSMIMSLLHVQNKVNALVKKTRNTGTLLWDGKDPRYLTLQGIPKTDSLVKGDTILTGNYSLSYPRGCMIGTVAQIVPDASTNFYVLKIKTTANLSDLQQVSIVENLQYAEQATMQQETRKKIEDVKKK